MHNLGKRNPQVLVLRIVGQFQYKETLINGCNNTNYNMDGLLVTIQDTLEGQIVSALLESYRTSAEPPW